MIRTRVGYCGGKHPNPTYRDMGDQTETTEVDFDPARISYDQILDIVWASHNPCGASYSRQYMTAIFYGSDEQKRVALASLAKRQVSLGTINTQVLPKTTFTLAEDYHQKYYLRNDRALMKELAKFHFTEAEFANSTAVARLNAYVGGHGTASQLEADLSGLGLADESGRLLLARLKR